MGMIVYEENLERKLYHAQQVEATTFLGLVSHELRTPIYIVSSIICDLLQSGGLRKECDKKLEDAQQGCRMLEGLVENLLLMATVSSGSDAITLQRKPFDIRGCLERVLARSKDKVKPGVKVSLCVAENVPKVVATDEMRYVFLQTPSPPLVFSLLFNFL
jgi:signal transduction histidine kinase